MDYMTRHLVAKQTLRHEGQELKPGERFSASPVDADYLIRHKKAHEAVEEQVQDSAPVAQKEETQADLLELSIAKIAPQLPDLSDEQLSDLRAREQSGKARAGLIAAIDAEISRRSAE